MAGELVPRKSNIDLSGMSVPALYAELARHLTLTAQAVYGMVEIWTELEKRGEDLSEYKKLGLQKWFHPIATGLLSAEATIAFMHKDYALDALIGLPLALQQKIVDGYKIKVYAPGQSKPDEMTLEQMPSHLVKIVFRDGKILGPDKQKVLLQAKPRAKLSTTKRLLRTRVLVNRAKKTITVGQTPADIHAVVNALADAGGADREVIESKDRRAAVVAGKVTDEEKERLEAIAKANDTTLDAMVRKAVIAMYLL